MPSELVLDTQHQKNNVTLEASLSRVRVFYPVSMTTDVVLFLLFAILNYILHYKPINSCICYFPFDIGVL